MASAPVLGEVGVAVDGTIDPLLAKFAAAEKAADAFAARMQRKLKGVQIGGGANDNNSAERAADRMGRSLDRAGAAGQRYHQTLIQINNDNRTLIQVTDNSSRSFNRLTQNIDQSNRSINNHITNQRAAAGAARDSARALGETDAAAAGLRRTLLGSAGVIAGAFGLNELKNTADSYTRFTNQLKVAGLEGSNLGRTQEELFQSAQRYGVELEGLGTLYGRLAQSQNALGATSQQTMRFVNGVAAAIKVQGATAPQVQGALMQLSQAMGSTLVRAEEFNSINEGARPILVAVANGIEKYRGSVSALRNDVINGKLTSQEFFQGFLAGSSQLESQATRANLTIGASFTVLNNALGRYIGQTDQSLSATQRIGGGIQALARNLDVIMPILTAIILAMGARYAVAAGSMIASTSAAQLAVAAFRMVTQGTIVSVVALGEAGAVAGRSLLAAFGGPVGVAILAIGAAVYYFYQRSQEASKAVADFNQHQKEAVKVLEAERARASAAGGAVRQLGTDHGTAANQIKSFAGATGDAAKALYEQARAARRARFETLAYTLEQAKADKAAADKYVSENRQSDQSRARFGNLPENPEVQKARDRSAAAQRTIDQVQAVIDRAVKDPLETYVPNARTGGRDLAAEIAQLQQQLVAAQKAGLTEQQREILKQIKIRKRITELMQQGLNLEIASAQADTEALGPRGAAPEDGATRFGSPVAGRRITGRFGERRPGHTHAGVDIAVPAGTAVQATAGGTVIEAGTLPGYGNVIIIDHGRGMTTRYAHLSKLGVAKGTRVDAGQQIGLSGGVPGAPGAGRSTGAHLHYEVRKNGKAVDPNGAYAIDEVDAANKAEQLENQRLAREQAFGAQSQQLQDAILQAREQQLVDEQAIAQAAKDRINGERDRTRDEIESKRKRGEYDATQAAQLTAANEELRTAQLAANDFKERQRLAEQAVRIAERTHGWEMEALEAQQDIARTATERRAAERRILAAQKEYERQVLQAKIDSPFTKAEDRDAARHELGTLDERYGRRTGRLDREAIEDMYQAAPGDSAIGIRDQQRGIRRDRDDRLGAVDEGTRALLANEQLTQEERERILAEAAERRVAIEQDAQKRILDLETQRKTLQLQNAQDIADGLATIAEGIAGKQSGIYRGLFATAKAFAIAQASIALYQNVAEAMKIGFPQNLPFIAAAIAQGASIVGNINAISAQFDTGGWTGNGSRYAPAGTVHGQEFVVRAGPAGRNRKMLEDINAGRDPTMSVQSASSSPGGLAGGAGSNRPLNVKVQNYAPGVRHEVQQGMTRDEVILIAREEAPRAVAADLDRPNGRVRKSMQRNTTARGRKS